MNRLRIIVDGGYLFHVFAPYRDMGLKYSCKRLARLLSKEYSLRGVHYVDSINERNPSVKAHQERFFFDLLRDTLGWDVTILPLQWPGGEPRQKGTDSAITLLIYEMAVRDEYDTLILLAADSDFCLPVVQAVKAGKIVRNAYFSARPSYHLQESCNGEPIRLDDLDFFYRTDDPRTLITLRSVTEVPAEPESA
jgi:uncharacterized LabA/DUF88 family protein